MSEELGYYGDQRSKVGHTDTNASPLAPSQKPTRWQGFKENVTIACPDCGNTQARIRLYWERVGQTIFTSNGICCDKCGFGTWDINPLSDQSVKSKQSK